jgi:hypothetical protein
MWKLVLSGAAFAALTVGSASAADLAVRPAYRAPQSVHVKPHPVQRRAPVAVVHARLGNMCWVSADGALYHAVWQTCPRPAATRTVKATRTVVPRTERTARKGVVRRGRITRTVHAPVADNCRVTESSKQYWATSLSDTVDSGLLQGLRDAVGQKEVGWLDVDPKSPVPAVAPGTNLIFYHVGGNCYIGSDCDRFPSSKPTGDRWGNEEREIDLTNAETRRIVVADLVNITRQADELAPNGATVGVHLDNVHKLDATGLARVFNEYLQAVAVAKQQGLISKNRTVGYIAKNNPEGFKKALDEKLLRTAPLYQINENATLSQDGALDKSSRVAQDIGRLYRIPVFLKTFGTDVAYTIEQDGKSVEVHVSEDMTRQMARMPNISGAAWSADEARYQPTLFAQGSPVRQRRRVCDQVAMVSGTSSPSPSGGR